MHLGRNSKYRKLHDKQDAKERQKVYEGFILSEAILANGVKFTVLKPGIAEGAEFGNDPHYGIQMKLRRTNNA